MPFKPIQMKSNYSKNARERERVSDDGTERNPTLKSGSACWGFEKSVTLRRDKNSPKYKLIKATLAGST